MPPCRSKEGVRRRSRRLVSSKKALAAYFITDHGRSVIHVMRLNNPVCDESMVASALFAGPVIERQH